MFSLVLLVIWHAGHTDTDIDLVLTGILLEVLSDTCSSVRLHFLCTGGHTEDRILRTNKSALTQLKREDEDVPLRNGLPEVSDT
jgi:hypothetical protein